jgi:hypothetical protein
MLSYDINLDDAAARGSLGALIERVEDREGLHQAMGGAVAHQVREHIRTTKKSPKTNWWGDAADSVTHRYDSSLAVVSVPQRGAALRLYGGTVSQKPGGPLLALPTDDVPVEDHTRKAPREMGPLFFLPARRPARKGVVGVLLEGELTGKSVQSGKNKGKPAKRQKEGGSLLYVLMTETNHDPDPTVLPSDDEIRAEAVKAGGEFLNTLRLPNT